MNRPDDAEYRAGLSPLARGTQRPCAPGSGCVRFIPAGAGNTQRECAGFNWTPVYPRWRGEHSFASCKAFYPSGLSPLARGTHVGGGAGRYCKRFIPAGAGNTNQAEYSINPTTVYPRWRGEHLQPKLNFGFVIGLSPLARGTLLDIPEHCADLRFIPAGAGNTNQAEYSINPTTVYPRWRGEHSSTPARRVRVSGLSPLARGTRPASG